MRRPIYWDCFRWQCKQHEYTNCNLYAEEKRHSCKRNNRPRYDLLSCHWNVCPKLKEIRKEIKEGKLKEPVDLEIQKLIWRFGKSVFQSSLNTLRKLNNEKED